MSVSRQQLVVLVRDMLALKTAQELGLFQPPSQNDLDALRENAAATAESLLDLFGDTIIHQRVCDLIVKDVRAALLRRTRLSSIMGWGLAVSPVLAGIVVGADQFLLATPINVEAIKTTYWIVLGILVAQVLGFAYLRYLDRAP